MSACSPRICPRRAVPGFLAAILLLGGAASAHAQGFGVYEQGSCAMARAGAAVAEPCEDGSAVFFNPGALGNDLDQDAWTFSGGATLVAVEGGFRDDHTGTGTNLDADAAVPPHAYVRYGVSDRFTVGGGLYVPYGLGTKWPEDFDGAFTGFDNSLESIYVQPTVAYRWGGEEGLSRLPFREVSLGGGPALVIGGVELNQMLDLSEQPLPEGLADLAGLPAGTTFDQLGVPYGTAFARAGFDASGALGLGGHVGLQVQASERLSFGARFLTPVTLDYEGDASFGGVSTGLTIPRDNPFGLPEGTSVDQLVQASFGEDAPLRDQDVETELTMPAQAVFGAAAHVLDGLRFMVDYQWTGWSDFDSVELRFAEEALNEEIVQNYEDTHGVRVGGEYDLAEAWTLGAGYIYNTEAAPAETVTPLLPESDRNHMTLGLGWRASERFTIHAAYHLLEQNDRRGRTRGPRNGDPGVELNHGLYQFRGHLFGATLTVDIP